MATPLPPDEIVLRRVHRSFIDVTKSVPIQVIAFRPNKNDTEGLSFFRESVVSAQQLLQGARQSKDKYVVVRIRASDVYSLGLTLIDDELPGLPGHCLIPELNCTLYKANRHASMHVLEELSRLASQDIVEVI